MNRRTFLFASAAAGALSAEQRSQMGIAVTCYLSFARPKDNLEFLEHAHALGAGGIQMPLTSREPDYIRKLRGRAEQYGMYFEAIARLPDKQDTAAFEATVAALKEAGALVVRVNCLPGRRYENFSDLDDWRHAVPRAEENIDAALRIAEKHKLPLALENHKDFTAEEMAALMKRKSSRWFGVCLDTGNNISLLDDPMALVETLAPYALCTHLKDMGVAPYPDGFLLSEMPLGEGMLDMRRVVDTIRRARPETRLTLEMITRDPLKIPCLTDRYWATLPDRNGRYLARTLRLVGESAGRAPLPVFSGLAREVQLQLEEDNVVRSLQYARARLAL
ncbi:MAG TPA: sugar phosphate isomerase/epimerase family protein [Bryobacteraceae bacterium]|nr:sugar phosphate isomerase/epimerase family protein [Bryobacteraceae bacterium]